MPKHWVTRRTKELSMSELQQVQLPEGWESKVFEKCLEKVQRATKIPKKKFLDKGSYPIISQESDFINGYWNDVSDVLEIEKPVVIFGDHTKIVKYVDFPFVQGADGVKVLQPIDNIDARFFYYQLQSISLADLGYARHYRLLKQETVVIPPLETQKQIVAVLDNAFAAIDVANANIEKNLQNAKELFESYLQKVFENNTHGSESVTLNSICDLIVDCEHKTAPTQETGYPSIRTPNIGHGELILDGVKKVSEKTYKEWTRRAVPEAGDLILAREAPAGNIAIIPKNLKVCLGQRTVLIRPKKDFVFSKYIAFLTLSKDVQKRLLSHSKGVTVGHINMKDIRAFNIYNLPNINKQREVTDEIDEVLSQAKKIEYCFQKKRVNIEELKKSILQKAFAGKLELK